MNLIFKDRQSGSVLLVSLIFIIVIALMSLSSMQSSKLGLRMAFNEEVRTNAFEIAQSLGDAVIALPAMTPVIGGPGYTLCTPGQPGCDAETISMPAGSLAAEVSNGHLGGTAVLMAPGGSPPPRGLGYSADKFAASAFQVTSAYDRAEDGLGRASVTRGLLVMTPLN